MEERENVAVAAVGIRILAKREREEEGEEKKKKKKKKKSNKCNPREKARFLRPNRSRLTVGASGRHGRHAMPHVTCLDRPHFYLQTRRKE